MHSHSFAVCLFFEKEGFDLNVFNESYIDIVKHLKKAFGLLEIVPHTYLRKMNMKEDIVTYR